jgi:hypothetical protein
LATSGREKNHLCHYEKFEKKLVFLNLKWFSLCFEIWQNWPYHQNEMKKVWIFIFESLTKIFILKFEKESSITLERNEKNRNISFVPPRKFWNKKFRKTRFWNLKKIWPYQQGEMKKRNKEIIYFVYATKKKTTNNTLHHLYHICIPPYTTC